MIVLPKLQEACELRSGSEKFESAEDNNFPDDTSFISFDFKWFTVFVKSSYNWNKIFKLF